MLSYIYNAAQTHIRKWMFSFWLKMLEPTKPRGLLMHNPKLFVPHPCAESLQTVLNGRFTPCATVFWGAECSGKTHAISHMAYDIECKYPTRKFIFVDWLNYFATNNESPIEWFYRQMGLDSRHDQSYLPTNLDCADYTTIIFDHFDWAMREQHAYTAKQLVLNLAMESSTTGGFNVLVCVTDATNARALLTIKPHQHFVKLLSDPCAGCWEEDAICMYIQRATSDRSRSWLAQNGETIQRATETGIVSGTLREVISILNDRHYNDHYYALRAGQARNQWQEGYEMLKFYARTDDAQQA